MHNAETLYLVIPCYNEEEVLHETANRLLPLFTRLTDSNIISGNSRVLFVDDGSRDATWPIIEELHQGQELFTGIKLSRNRGHQNALLAGLETAYRYADVVISMDADLQDDINAIDAMLEHYRSGYDIVYGVRSERKEDTFFKRFTAESFYKLMRGMGADTVYNHADYRLMSKRAVEALTEYRESNLFLRGIIPQIGYPSTTVTYERHERFAGKSKYPLKKMLAFATDGITSFSSKPLLLILELGLLLSVMGCVAFIVTLILKYTQGLSAMWPLLSALAFFTGIIVSAIGVVGIYVGKTYIETKHRPRYFIEKSLL